MDWESAKKHCKERNWDWSLELINQAEKEMEDLETENKMLKDQQKAQRLYNACNYWSSRWKSLKFIWICCIKLFELYPGFDLPLSAFDILSAKGEF